VGVGGIVTGADAAELLAAGANAVQVGTAIFADPRAPAQLVEDLSGWCAAHGVERVSDLTDRAQRALGATRRAPAVTAAH
jgi:dihydroorotate dehydrogenase (NAD+) catalytic subunit